MEGVLEGAGQPKLQLLLFFVFIEALVCVVLLICLGLLALCRTGGT